MNPDLINSLFEFMGCLFVLNNVRILYNDKEVKGVSVVSTLGFTLWGFWNLYYYPHLNQMLSFAAAVLIVLVNIVYVSLMIYYTKFKDDYNKSS